MGVNAAVVWSSPRRSRAANTVRRSMRRHKASCSRSFPGWDNMPRLPPRFVIAVVVPFLLVILGTVGFHHLEEQPYFDSLYLTIVTLTTVGYGDIVPHTAGGKAFTMILVLCGVFTFFYGATTAIQAIV